MSKIKQIGNTTQLVAGKKYRPNVVGEPLISVEDTENGYHITEHSYSSCDQDLHYSIDYSLADSLRKVLNYLHKENKCSEML